MPRPPIEQAAAAMGGSRQTIGSVLEHGCAQVAEALVTGNGVLIGGGQYRVEARVLELPLMGSLPEVGLEGACRH